MNPLLDLETSKLIYDVVGDYDTENKLRYPEPSNSKKKNRKIYKI